MTADLRALAEAAAPGRWNAPAEAAFHAAANPTVVIALLDERDVIAESLGGMVEWLAEVIVDAREALVAERLRYVGDLRGSRPPGKVPIDMGAVLAILDRERNADPSRFDAMRDERDALRAEVDHLRGLGRQSDGWRKAMTGRREARAAIQRVRALHAPAHGYCSECSCDTGHLHPCATIRALDGEAS